MERGSLWHKWGAFTTEHLHRPPDCLLDRWCCQEVLMMMMMQTMINRTMMKMMIRVITPHCLQQQTNFPPQLLELEGRTSIHSISQSIGFTLHYWLPLTGIEPGVICMLWHYISLMISGFTAHLSACGCLGFSQKSFVWCACQDKINVCIVNYKLEMKVNTGQAY